MNLKSSFGGAKQLYSSLPLDLRKSIGKTKGNFTPVPLIPTRDFDQDNEMEIWNIHDIIFIDQVFLFPNLVWSLALLTSFHFQLLLFWSSWFLLNKLLSGIFSLPPANFPLIRFLRKNRNGCFTSHSLLLSAGMKKPSFLSISLLFFIYLELHFLYLTSCFS